MIYLPHSGKCPPGLRAPPRLRPAVPMSRVLILTATLSATAAIELPLLPTPAAFVILPGERRRFATNSDRMCRLLSPNACVAQLLERPGGNFDVAPILKVTDLFDGCAELTCVGRGRLGARRESRGVARAEIEPLYDQAPSHQIDAACLSVRILYHSCHSLAESARRDPDELSASVSDVVDLFDAPLETLLKERDASISEALSGVRGCERDLHTMANDACLQMLSLTTVRLLSPKARASLVVSHDTCYRLRRAEAALRVFEQQLVDEICACLHT